MTVPPDPDPRRAAALARAGALDATRHAVGATITARAHDAAVGATLAAPAPSSPAITAPGDVSLPTLPHVSLAITADLAEDSEDAAAAPRARLAGEGEAELTVTAVLGEGGMGRVLLARQRSLGREVAVKVLRRDVEGDMDANARALLAEARTAGMLEHPSVVPVHALGRDDTGQPVLVMKRIEGVAWTDLADDATHAFWARVQPDSDDRATAHVEILMLVCNAVHFAHSRGVIHRDIKPDNVMIGGFGEVYLADWGVAMHTGTPRAREGAPAGEAGASGMTLVGTPAYMAPEMLTGELADIDARTDVFLLGATLHRVLTGEHRHEGASVMEVLGSIFDTQPVAYPPGVPAELAAICNRATAADRAARYPTALAFKQALADYLRHRGSVALSDAGRRAFAELRAALDARADRSPGDAPRIHRLGTECRFGFAQALRAWSENPSARAGLRDVLTALAHYELDGGHVDAARALMAELPEPSRALEARAREVDAANRERLARDARLSALEHDLDLRVGATARRRLLLGLLFAGMTGGTAALLTGTAGAHRVLSAGRLVAISVGFLVFMLVGIGLGRRQLLGTAINRRIVGVILMGLIGVLAHRVLAPYLGITPFATVVSDLLIFAVVTATGALGVDRAMWSVPPIFLLGVPVALRFPAQGVVVFSVTVTLALARVGWAVGRATSRAGETRSRPGVGAP